MSRDNLNTYTSANVINWYSNLKNITPAEELFFTGHKKLLLNAKVLDIGIGGGRTTAYLLDKCGSYTGIDYSPGFVNTVKKKYPAANILLADARNLAVFDNEFFDMVNFSFNGIDYADHNDRTKILSEINRVLKPNGIFFFSTHNKDHKSFNKHPWLNKENSAFTNFKTCLKLVPFLLRHLTQKKNEIYTGNYAIINDSAHNYSLMTFYTSPAFLKQQLKENAFADIVLFSKTGKITAENELDEWVFVSCKKLFT